MANEAMFAELLAVIADYGQEGWPPCGAPVNDSFQVAVDALDRRAVVGLDLLTERMQGTRHDD